MMQVSEFVTYLKAQYPTYDIYNGGIDKNKKQCIGVFQSSSAPQVMALGGLSNTSYDILPVNILVHWGENASAAASVASAIYHLLRSNTNFNMGTRSISYIEMLDAVPVNIARDERNIAELSIRANIIYRR